MALVGPVRFAGRPAPARRRGQRGVLPVPRLGHGSRRRPSSTGTATPSAPLAGVGPVPWFRAKTLLTVLLQRVRLLRVAWGLETRERPRYPTSFAVGGPVTTTDRRSSPTTSTWPTPRSISAAFPWARAAAAATTTKAPGSPPSCPTRTGWTAPPTPSWPWSASASRGCTTPSRASSRSADA